MTWTCRRDHYISRILRSVSTCSPRYHVRGYGCWGNGELTGSDASYPLSRERLESFHLRPRSWHMRDRLYGNRACLGVSAPVESDESKDLPTPCDTSCSSTYAVKPCQRGEDVALTTPIVCFLDILLTITLPTKILRVPVAVWGAGGSHARATADDRGTSVFWLPSSGGRAFHTSVQTKLGHTRMAQSLKLGNDL